MDPVTEQIVGSLRLVGPMTAQDLALRLDQGLRTVERLLWYLKAHDRVVAVDRVSQPPARKRVLMYDVPQDPAPITLTLWPP